MDLNEKLSVFNDYCINESNNDNDDGITLNDICDTYLKYGFCKLNEKHSCSKVHNTGLIVNFEIRKEQIGGKKRKLKTSNKQVIGDDNNNNNENQKVKNIKLGNENVNNVEGNCSKSSELPNGLGLVLPSVNSIHNSAIDSFMTGYIFAYFCMKYSNLTDIVSNCSNEIIKLDNLNNLNCWLNNVYLTGKDHPLIVNKSSFVKTSMDHQENIRKVMQKNESTS